jgi:hypothetical protein
LIARRDIASERFNSAAKLLRPRFEKEIATLSVAIEEIQKKLGV